MTTSPYSQPTGRGRLSAERVAEVYEAVIAELALDGYDKLSFDAIAQRASCSKATLYRLWDGKLDLVVTALACAKAAQTQPRPEIDTGSLRGDLHLWAEVATPEIAVFTPVIIAVLRATLDSNELSEAFRSHLSEQEGAPDDITTIVRRAVDRGEIPDTGVIDNLHYLFLGPMLGIRLFTGRDLLASDLVSYIDAVVLPALGAPLN